MLLAMSSLFEARAEVEERPSTGIHSQVQSCGASGSGFRAKYLMFTVEPA